MEKFENSQTINLTNNYSIIINENIKTILKNIKKDVSIIYFSDSISTDDYILNILKNNKLIFTSNVNAKTIKKANKNIIIIAKLNNDYKYSKFIIKNIQKLFVLSNKYNKTLGVQNLDSKIISLLYSNDSKYINDILNTFRVMLLPTKEKKYEFIYDTVCDYLDNEFHKCNFCDFKNNQCVANRLKRYTKHKTMGCCYSFDYTGLLDIRIVKNVKLCKYMKDRACTTKNISCKLFTCRDLKEKNICFNTHKILLLDCFFNTKQHEIIKSNFFRTKEEILNKLLEKNHDTYLIFYMLKRYAIKN